MKVLNRGLAAVSFKCVQGAIILTYNSGQGSAAQKVLPLSGLALKWHHYQNAANDVIKIIAFDSETNTGVFHINTEDPIFDGAACTPVVPNGATINDVFSLIMPFIPLIAASTPGTPSANEIVNVDDATPSVTVPPGCKSWTCNIFQDVKIEIGGGGATIVVPAGQPLTTADMQNTLLYGVIITQITPGHSATINYII